MYIYVHFFQIYSSLKKFKEFEILKLNGNEICAEAVVKITNIFASSGKIIGG